jgi:polyhydroxyalkanoate synthase
MSQESVAAQTAQFWELLQRSQALALSAQSTALAKAAGQQFSVVDANSAGAAAMKAFAEFAQHPIELAAFQQTVLLDATKAWVDAWTGESPAVADKRFRDKRWDEDR